MEDSFRIQHRDGEFLINIWEYTIYLRNLRKYVEADSYIVQEVTSSENLKKFFEYGKCREEPVIDFSNVFDFYRLSKEFAFNEMINACQNYFQTHQCALSIIINYFQKRCQNELNELENMGNRKLTDIIHQIRDQSPNDEVKIEDEFTLEEFVSHNITSIVSVCPNVFDLFSSESLFRILEHFSLNSTQNQSNITEFDDEQNEFHLDYNKLFSYFFK